MPNYTRHGKLLEPLTREQFLEGMKSGTFHNPTHRSYVTLLFYTGLRRQEGLNLKPENFIIDSSYVYVDAGKRLKHGKVTPPIPIPRTAKYAELIVRDVRDTKPSKRVWRFSPATAWLIFKRVWDNYPHHFRLSRITRFFTPDPETGKSHSIAEVQNWTGLTLQSLNYYVGIVDMKRMGETLKSA